MRRRDCQHQEIAKIIRLKDRMARLDRIIEWLKRRAEKKNVVETK